MNTAPRKKPRKLYTFSAVSMVAFRERRQRAQRVVEWLDKALGYGWKHRMETVDRWLDQDMPREWCNGTRVPSERLLRRLEEYARTFGYESSSSSSICALAHTRTRRDLVDGLEQLAKGCQAPN